MWWIEKRWKKSFHYNKLIMDDCVHEEYHFEINPWVFMINIIIFLKHFEGLSTGGGRIENELESFELDKFSYKIM